MTEITSRLSTALADRYKIERHLGEGGMLPYLGMRSLFAGLIVSVGLGACLSSNRTEANDPNTLTIDYGGDAYLLGPAGDDTPKFLVFLPLARWDNSCRTGEHVGLAERWEYTPDRRRWTFHLRPNLRWHDGVPVTARDIEFSINLWKHPDVLWYGAAPVDSVDVIDDYTVTLFSRRPLTYSDLDWDVYYPKHLLEDLDPKGFFTWDFWTRPVGNGPYRYVRHDPETHIEFEANPDYYEGEPPIERVVITLAEVPGMLRLLAGETDLGGGDPLDAARFVQNDEFNVYYGGWGTPIRLVWNVRHAFFRDKEIRQALTMAIDRRALLRVVGLPDEIPISDGTYSSCHFERRDLPPAWPYDPAAAQSILDGAGWRDTDGDGIRDRNGQPFRFFTLVSPRWERAAIFAQDQLSRVGIRMEVQMLANSIVSERFGAGDFEAAIPRLSRLDFRFGQPDSPNGYTNVRVQELVARILETLDREILDRQYRELAEIFYDEIPGTFLHPRLRAMVARRWIRGLDGSMVGFPRVERLWIERDH
jgi:peptide/nickel transport system substrate-binding protein